MRNFQAHEGRILYPAFEKKPQSDLMDKGEGAVPAVSDLVEFLCSPHRAGRYRLCSFEKDVEYLRWFMQDH